MIEKEIITKAIVKDFDDSDVIYLDWNKIIPEDLNILNIGKFNVTNIPFKSFDKLVHNYYISFFECIKSDTGYCAMFIAKDRNVYKNNRLTKYEI